jgi:hypothetical protein
MSRKPSSKPKKAKTARVHPRRLRRAAASGAKKPTRRRTAGKSASAGVIDSLMAASAQVLRLPVHQSWHDGIRFNLELIFRIAALVDEFFLPDDTEPGPVFHA